MTCAGCSKPVAACVCPPRGGCGLPGHVTGGSGTGPGATHWCETCALLAEAGRLCSEATRLAVGAGVGWEVDEIILPPGWAPDPSPETTVAVRHEAAGVTQSVHPEFTLYETTDDRRSCWTCRHSGPRRDKCFAHYTLSISRWCCVNMLPDGTAAEDARDCPGWAP